jgi:hypothetical protein
VGLEIKNFSTGDKLSPDHFRDVTKMIGSNHIVDVDKMVVNLLDTIFTKSFNAFCRLFFFFFSQKFYNYPR